MSANHQCETLWDLARHSLPLRVTCRCGHRAVLDPRPVSQHYGDRGWSIRMHMVGDHLRCTRCGARGPRVG